MYIKNTHSQLLLQTPFTRSGQLSTHPIYDIGLTTLKFIPDLRVAPSKKAQSLYFNIRIFGGCTIYSEQLIPLQSIMDTGAQLGILEGRGPGDKKGDNINFISRASRFYS